MKIPITEKKLISIREAAAIYSIGLKSFRRMAENHAGEFAIFIGNRWLISPERLEAYLFSMEKEEAAELMENEEDELADNSDYLNAL